MIFRTFFEHKISISDFNTELKELDSLISGYFFTSFFSTVPSGVTILTIYIPLGNPEILI